MNQRSSINPQVNPNTVPTGLMAAVDTKLPAQGAKPGVEPLIRHESSKPPSNDEFDPKKHLAFILPSKTYTMEDIKLPRDTGVSSFAVSEPFQLFTEEAVRRMRAEILSREVWENCQYSSNLAQCQLRGFAPK